MKKVNSIFDVLGPIMIGPSSSHTAGAARLAKVASCIAGGNIVKVKFFLHGSFQHTYKGHGSDRALLAGVLGLEPYDEELRNSFKLAEEKKLKYEFIPEDLGPVHPNTIKFELENDLGIITTVVGCSIGGGAILINNINGHDVHVTGEYHTIIVNYPDIKGMISKISSVLSNDGINIATMNVSRNSRGKNATMIIETDGIVSKDTINKINQVEQINTVIDFKPIKAGELNV
jgi:L-serine dehydratase